MGSFTDFVCFCGRVWLWLSSCLWLSCADCVAILYLLWVLLCWVCYLQHIAAPLRTHTTLMDTIPLLTGSFTVCSTLQLHCATKPHSWIILTVTMTTIIVNDGFAAICSVLWPSFASAAHTDTETHTNTSRHRHSHSHIHRHRPRQRPRPRQTHKTQCQETLISTCL